MSVLLKGATLAEAPRDHFLPEFAGVVLNRKKASAGNVGPEQGAGGPINEGRVLSKSAVILLVSFSSLSCLRW